MSGRPPRGRGWATLCLLVLASLFFALPGAARASEARLVVPGTVVFSPEAPGREATLVLSNPSPSAVSIESLGVRGRDWGGFVITDERNPTSVPAEGRVELHLRVDTRAFEVAGDHAEGKSYREGRAELQLRTSSGAFEVPLRFVPTPTPSVLPSLCAFGLWCLVLGAFAMRGVPLPADRLARGLTLGALLGVFAALPLGPGWCEDPSVALAGQLAAARCRMGLGGGHLALVPALVGAWWLAAGLTVLAFVRHSGERSDFDRERLAWLFAALVLAAMGSAGWDLAANFGESFLPRPGLALACIGAWALSRRADADPASDLAWAATVTVIFAGGPRLPGPAFELGSASTTLALGVVILAAKVWGLLYLVRWCAQRAWIERAVGWTRVAGLLGFAYGALSGSGSGS